MRASITGFFKVDDNLIFLEDVIGIYADRGSPRKAGFWIKLKDCTKPKGIVKIFADNLTPYERAIVTAAARYNQAVQMAEHYKEK